MFFILTEALIGAGLVLFELVAGNASLARALSLAVHLVNTFLLLAALTFTAWSASSGKPVLLRGQGVVGLVLALAVVGSLILGMSGAVTALGDTLFRVSSIAEALRQDLSPTAHFLIKLRLFHPAIAAVVGLTLALAAGLARSLRPGTGTKRRAWMLIALVFIQLGAGALNVALLAPVWLQLVHLLLADLLWITLLLLALATLAERPPGGAVASPAA